ncbi:hypothetical protein C8T65DRAFT_704055, partial [Cerioporus squamosus]
DYIQIYGENLEWIVNLVPASLLTIIPPSIWASYVVTVNQGDNHLHVPSEDLGIAAWIMNGCRLYRQILCPQQTYLHERRFTASLTAGWTNLRVRALGEGRLRGDFVLAHPKILTAMSFAFETPVGRDYFVKKRIEDLSNAFCWPQSAYLELAAHQLRGFLQAPWRTWAQYITSTGEKATLTFKSNAIASISSSFQPLSDPTSCFAFIDSSLLLAERHERTSNIITSLSTLGPDASPELVALWDALDNSYHALKWPSLPADDVPILWISYFRSTSPSHGFQKIARVVYILIWLLMGPIPCNLLLSIKNIDKIPGQLRWSKSPDSIILHYFKFARTARSATQGAPNYSLDDGTNSIDKLYAEAEPEDIKRLYSAAGFLLKHGEDMCEELNGPLKSWFKRPNKFFTFHGYEESAAPGHDIVYVEGMNQDLNLYEHFCAAVNKLVNNSIRWQQLLFEVLQVDLLFVDGVPFFCNPDNHVIRINSQPTLHSPFTLQSSLPHPEPSQSSAVRESTTLPLPESSQPSAAHNSASASPLDPVQPSTAQNSAAPPVSDVPSQPAAPPEAEEERQTTPSQWESSDRSNNNSPRAGPARSSSPRAGPARPNSPRAGPARFSSPRAGPARPNSPRAGPAHSTSPRAGPARSSSPRAGPAHSTSPRPFSFHLPLTSLSSSNSSDSSENDGVSLPAAALPAASVVSSRPSTPPLSTKRPQTEVDISPQQDTASSHPRKRSRQAYVEIATRSTHLKPTQVSHQSVESEVESEDDEAAFQETHQQEISPG